MGISIGVAQRTRHFLFLSRFSIYQLLESLLVTGCGVSLQGMSQLLRRPSMPKVIGKTG